ncbi:MAG TPA: hypothetical protein VKZ18_17125 [Polyangia bacterium]|nr:hypothetical protein [Polyangia bacterium]
MRQFCRSVGFEKPSQPNDEAVSPAPGTEVAKQTSAAAPANSQVVQGVGMIWQLSSQVPGAGGSQVSFGSMMPSPQTPRSPPSIS